MAPWFFGRGHRRSDRLSSEKVTGVLITLDEGTVSVKLDDFSDELVVSNLDQFVHLGASHALSDNNWIGSELRGPDTLKILP